MTEPQRNDVAGQIDLLSHGRKLWLGTADSPAQPIHGFKVQTPTDGQSFTYDNATGLMVPTYLESSANYKHIARRALNILTLGAGATINLGDGDAASTAAGVAGVRAIDLDPTLWSAPGALAKKLLLTVAYITNGTNPGTTFTTGLYPATPAGGGNNVVSMTNGTVTSGSTVVCASPTNTTGPRLSSGDFAAPSAGLYEISCVVLGAMAANSTVTVIANLWRREV